MLLSNSLMQSTITLTFVVSLCVAVCRHTFPLALGLVFTLVAVCVAVHYHTPIRSRSCFHPCLSFTLSVLPSMVTRPFVQRLVFTLVAYSLCCSLLSHCHSWYCCYHCPAQNVLQLSFTYPCVQGLVFTHVCRSSCLCGSLLSHLHAFSVLFSPLPPQSVLHSIVTLPCVQRLVFTHVSICVSTAVCCHSFGRCLSLSLCARVVVYCYTPTRSRSCFHPCLCVCVAV